MIELYPITDQLRRPEIVAVLALQPILAAIVVITEIDRRRRGSC